MIPWSPLLCILQLADQSIRRPVGIAEDIPVRIRNSFMPVDFVVLKMDVCHQILLILMRPFFSITRAMIDVAPRIIKLNISRKEETSTFKPNGTKKCNQVMLTIRPERNAMTPDKKPNTAENFSTKFSERIKNAIPVATRSLVAPMN
jgi:SUMO ligase MMS21 Smc5/6 complex component